MIGEIAAIGIGGAAGAVLRFGANEFVTRMLGSQFPWGILLVNVAGSLLMGCCYVLLVERQWVDETWRAGLMVGLLGAFTTFSTFSIQTLQLMQQGRLLAAGGYCIASVGLCVFAAGVGMLVTRAVIDA